MDQSSLRIPFWLPQIYEHGDFVRIFRSCGTCYAGSKFDWPLQKHLGIDRYILCSWYFDCPTNEPQHPKRTVDIGSMIPGKPGCKNIRAGGDNVMVPSRSSDDNRCSTYIVYRSFKHPPPIPPLGQVRVGSTGTKKSTNLGLAVCPICDICRVENAAVEQEKMWLCDILSALQFSHLFRIVVSSQP